MANPIIVLARYNGNDAALVRRVGNLEFHCSTDGEASYIEKALHPLPGVEILRK